MYRNSRPVSTIQLPNQSIHDFPLPPGTPRLELLSNDMQDDSVPEFDKNFRFPNTELRTSHYEDLDDPEHTFRRLKNEVEILTARLAQDFTNLESPLPSPIPSKPQVKSNPSGSNRRYSSRYIQSRPKTSYGCGETPRFSFRDLNEWDLRSEGDEKKMTGRDGEDYVQRHLSPRVRANSLHSCKSQRRMKDKPELVIPVHVRKYIIAQERARADQERAAEEERKSILHQTREAVMHISEAGFDFGFQETEHMALEVAKLSEEIPVTTPNVAISVPKSETNIKTTVVKIPPKRSHMITPTSTRNSPNIIWPSRAESTHWPGWGNGDSGIALASPPHSPKSAPPPITNFPDLPEPLRLNRPEKLSPSINIDKFIKPSNQELSCWSASPELSQREKLDLLIQEENDGEKRRGFWRKMKDSMFSRKKSTQKSKELVSTLPKE